ncbi:hypothetical protein RHGRI_023012 [Rhododendron griersonianum]|uniref:Uncharacterized protein n=1 Tax=Rhododendron griersonianum TaxID=479676 RepID=A0AAV6J3L4_9ERIC|nr:hypothetical protein RHGRI_023012 [Rhododendron griersonianum]
MTRMPIAMLKEVRPDPVPQALHVFLPEMLHQMPVCAPRVLWEQSCVPLLQQLEDQGRWPQVPLENPHSNPYLQ